MKESHFDFSPFFIIWMSEVTATSTVCGSLLTIFSLWHLKQCFVVQSPNTLMNTSKGQSAQWQRQHPIWKAVMLWFSLSDVEMQSDKLCFRLPQVAKGSGKRKRRKRGTEVCYFFFFPFAGQMKESEEKAKGISLTSQRVGWGRGRPPLGAISFFRTGEGAQGQRRLPETPHSADCHTTPPLHTESSPRESADWIRNALKTVWPQVWPGHREVVWTTTERRTADLPNITTTGIIVSISDNSMCLLCFTYFRIHDLITGNKECRRTTKEVDTCRSHWLLSSCSWSELDHILRRH